MTKKVACLLGPDFEDSEFEIPVERMRAEGFQVDVIGVQAGETLTGKLGRVTVTIDKGIEDARPEDYDLVLIPGGYSPDNLRIDRRFVDFVKAFNRLDKPIAAVCHGPQLLAAAHLVGGRTLTAWPTVRDDLEQMGANAVDQPVVIDGNWITSRMPDDLQLFSDAIVMVLKAQEEKGRMAA